MAPEQKQPRTWGEWQTRERKARNWSQATLAKNSGVSERSIKRYEAGHGAPGGANVWLILSAFGFPTPTGQPRSVNAELADLRVAVDQLATGWTDLVGRVAGLGRGGDAP